MTCRLFAAAVCILLINGCSRGDEQPTAAETLAAIEGRELTEAEVSERQETAQLLCGLSDEVLAQIWDDLDKEGFAFQDFVFKDVCTERAAFYAESTGRDISVQEGS